jgi:hypothetical protein
MYLFFNLIYLNFIDEFNAINEKNLKSKNTHINLPWRNILKALKINKRIKVYKATPPEQSP